MREVFFVCHWLRQCVEGPVCEKPMFFRCLVSSNEIVEVINSSEKRLDAIMLDSANVVRFTLERLLFGTFFTSALLVWRLLAMERPMVFAFTIFGSLGLKKSLAKRLAYDAASDVAGFVRNRTSSITNSAASGFSRNQLPVRFVLALVICSVGVKVIAQEPPAKPTAPSTSSELVEGLLDLLNEPVTKKPTEASKQPLTPADIGLEGEDLGEASENPLLAVRQSMLIAAGYLRRDGANAETLKLQSDIVRRLDDLISEMEKSQSKEDKSKQESQQPASAQSNAQKQREQQNRPQTMKSRPGDRKNSESGDDRVERQGEPENPPTQRGSGGGTTVELSDAKSLQQDVWGQLPSRVRQQMQSRMVEKFLPAYKEQIEAYFQALLK